MEVNSIRDAYRMPNIAYNYLKKSGRSEREARGIKRKKNQAPKQCILM